jgi:Ca2+/H+ antiporter
MIGIGVCIGLSMLITGIKVNFNEFIFMSKKEMDDC